jgi:hypothetical protein
VVWHALAGGAYFRLKRFHPPRDRIGRRKVRTYVMAFGNDVLANVNGDPACIEEYALAVFRDSAPATATVRGSIVGTSTLWLWPGEPRSGWSWITGAPGAIACSGSSSAGRTSYSTSMASQARRATSGSSAATTATRSPTKRTLRSSITAS